VFFARALAAAVTATVQAATERWLFSEPPVALAPLISAALREAAEGLLATLPQATDAAQPERRRC
jgi:hypothetical protein